MKESYIRIRIVRSIGGKEGPTLNEIKYFLGFKGRWKILIQNYTIFGNFKENKFLYVIKI